MPPPPDLPERRSLIEIDRVVGTAATQTRHDRPPTRRGTLPGIPAQAGIPSPPRTPVEYGETLRAPSTTSATLRAPTPASGVTIVEPATGQPGASLPPVSESPEQARIAAQERELDKLRAEKAQLERDARAGAEARLQTYPPPKVERVPVPAPTVPVPPDGSVESLRKAQTKLLLGIGAALAALATPLAIWVTNVAAEAKTRSERATTQVTQATNEAEAAKTKAGANAKEAAATEREFRQYRANRRELDRLQGIEYPKSDGDPEPIDLKPYTPLCAPGKVCTGAQIILTRPL